MPKLAQAYIYQQHQLLVDADYQLPKLTIQADDLVSQKAPAVIVRAWESHQSVPIGFQFIALRQLIPQWSVQELEQASRALQLLEWKNNHQFCGRCGQQTKQHHTEFCTICTSCNLRQYPRISPCIITIITKGDEILLAKSVHRKDNIYGLIAGFVEVGETLEQAVARETKEEVGIDVKNIRYLSSQPWPFPSNLMIAFHAEYAGGDITLQEDEIADAQFFKKDQLPDIPFAGSIAHDVIRQFTVLNQS